MKNNVLNLLSYLKSKGARLKLVNGNLNIEASKNVITADIAGRIKANKAEIVSYLQQIHGSPKIEMVRADRFPLTNGQKRLWVISQDETQSIAYNLTGAFNLHFSIEEEVLKKAWRNVLLKHSVLRTVFFLEDGDIFQKILPINTEGYDLSSVNLESTIDYEEIQKNILIDADSPMDLENGPLCKAILYSLADGQQIFYYKVHHLISDGWSMQVLWSDLLQQYNALKAGHPVETNLPFNYCDFAVWQNNQKETDKYKSDKDYWLTKFEGGIPSMKLPYSDFNAKGSKSATHVLNIEDGSLLKKFQELAQAKNVSMFVVFTAVIKTLLYRYSGQENVTIGTPVSGRDQLDASNQIGLYINTILINSFINGQEGFNEILEVVNNNVSEALQHQNYPFDELMSGLDNANTESVSVFLEYVHQEQNDNVENEIVSPLIEIPELSKFDLTFKVYYSGSKVSIALLYRSSKFSDDTIKKMGNHLNVLIEKVVDNPMGKLDEVMFISEPEKTKLLVENNDTGFDHNLSKSILDRFQDRVNIDPNNTALIFGEKKVSYKEFDTMSNQVANYLLENQIGSGDFVSVALKPSIDRMVALFGVLKSGAAYLPISVDYPIERIEQIKDSSNFKCLISSRKGADLIDFEPVFIEDILEQSNAYDHPKIEIYSQSPAYVIYTSGSTGTPKGVVINHGALVNRIEWMQYAYPIGKEDVVLHKTIFTFDVSVWEIVWFSTQGAALSILPYGDEKLPDRIINQIDRDKVSVIHFVPAMLNGFLTFAESIEHDENSLKTLKYVFASGEELKGSYVNRFNAYFKNKQASLINLYGPTEATIDVTYFNCEKNQEYYSIPIGKPVHNVQLYILDKNLNVLPEGCLGELYIGGVQVSDGYLNDSKRTKEAFLDSPFDKGQKIYKTGDLARWNESGQVEFHGRVDNQVKIRGYRIELGEIELAIEALNQVEVCVVKVVEHGGINSGILAVVQLKESIDEQEIIRSVGEKLPDYMVPNHVLFIEEMPLSPNGKVNRKALANFNVNETVSEITLEPLLTENEQLLGEVWSHVLKQEKFGANSNFYALGGDSIKSILVASRLRQMGYELSVTDILSNPILSQMAKKIGAGKAMLITSEKLSGRIELNPTQEDFLASEELVELISHFNQSLVFKVREQLDISQFKHAFQEIVGLHEQLRARFIKENNTWVQEIVDENQIECEVLSEKFKSEEDFTKYLSRVQAGFNLEEAPLYKLVHATIGNEVLIAIVVHHLLIDGVSWRILLEDLSQYYSQGEILVERSHTSEDWNKLLIQKQKSGELNKDILFWTKFDKHEQGNLAPDFPEGKNTESTLKSVDVQLSKESTASIIKNAQKINTDVATISLAALKMASKDQFQKNNLVVQLEGHGREFSSEIDLTRTIGWYTSIYPVNLGRSENGAINEVKYIRNKLAAIPNNGATYLFLKNRNFVPDIQQGSILFNYLGDLGNDLSSGEDLPLEVVNIDRGGEIHKETKRKFELEISGMIIGGQLRLSVLYSDERWSEDNIRLFAKSLEEYLEQLSKLLKEPEVDNSTYHDFYFDLTADQFDTLNYSDIEQVYPMFDTQEGIFYHWLNDKESTQYINQISFSVKGEMNVNLLQQTLDILTRKHEVLRSRFDESTGELLQIILKETESSIEIKEISYSDAEHREVIRQDERKKLFDLRNEPAFRLLVLKYGDIHEVIWTSHHIIFDGWSLSLFINELKATYLQLTQGSFKNEHKKSSLLDYYRWSENLSTSVSQNFWNDYLKNVGQKEGLLAGVNGKFVKKEWDYHLGQETTTQIQTFCAEIGITQNNFFLYAWGLLLADLKGYKDVTFAAMNSGRSPEVEQIDEMLGLFINMNPVRINLRDESNIQQALVNFHASAIDAKPHQYLAFRKILSASGLNADIFDHVFLFQNFEKINGTFEQKDKGLEVVETTSYEETNYNFIVSVFNGNGWVIKFEYNHANYDTSFITHLQQRYIRLINDIVTSEEDTAIETILESDLNDLPNEVNLAEVESVVSAEIENDEQKILLDIWKSILEKDQVTINDDFFIIGGDSILSIKLTVLINKQFKSKLEIADIYSTRTIRNIVLLLKANQVTETDEPDLDEVLKQRNQLVESSKQLLSKLDEPDDYSFAYPMSEMEVGMLYDSLVGESGTYHIQTVYHISSESFDLNRLKNAMGALAHKHFVLRSEFHLNELGIGVHLIKKQLDLNIDVKDLTDLEEQESDTVISEFLVEERSNNFTWNDFPLWRIKLFKVTENKYVFVWQVHHALMDGWSSNQLFRELYLNYENGTLDYAQEDNELKAAYVDSIRISGNQLENTKASEFWKEYTSDIQDVNLFGTNSSGLERNLSLSKEETEKLRLRSKEVNLPLKSILLTTYLKTIDSFTYSSETIIGLVTNTRPSIERSEELLGNFLNTVPFKMGFTNEDFVSHVNRVENELIKIKAYDRYPLSRILKNSVEPELLSSAMMVLFNFNDFTRSSAGEINEEENTLEGFSKTKSKLDLSVELRDKLQLSFSFNSNLIVSNGEVLFVERFIDILNRFILEEEPVQIADSIVSKNIQHRTPWELFTDHVNAGGDQIAIRTEDIELSYAALNNLVEEIAIKLTLEGVKQGDILAVQMDESYWYTVAFLACMKLGAVYLPIDSALPRERKNYMLQNSEARFLWNKGGDSVSNAEVKEIKHDVLIELQAVETSFINPEIGAPLYMIYTSGTTGKPKGVLLSGEGISNLQELFINSFKVDSSDRILQFASSSFDASVWEYSMALLTGAELCFVNKETTQSVETFTRFLIEKEITVLTLPPVFLQNIEPLEEMKVRLLITAGSEPNFDSIKKWNRITDYVNAYGPTETSICSNVYYLPKNSNVPSRIPIGVDIPNVSTVVMNDKYAALPDGSIGEITIFGPGVALGYVGDTEKTSERFIESDGKIVGYKTGDFGSVIDGQLFFLGRQDNQIKIRGYRIELGEIESCAVEVEGVSQVAAFVENKKLTLIYVSELVTEELLRESLEVKLPNYMIPSQICALPFIPVNQNGKVDIDAASREIRLQRGFKKGTVIQEKSKAEEKVEALWKDVLNEEYVDHALNFFDAGGNSISLMQLHKKMETELGQKFPIVLLFQYSTIKEMSDLYTNHTKSSVDRTETIKRGKENRMKRRQLRVEK